MYARIDYQPIRENDSVAIQNNRPFDCLNEGLNLQAQSKDFLIERVIVLERQLKIRNSDCSRLLMERLTLKQQNALGASSFQRSSRLEELEQEVKELRQRNRELEQVLLSRGEPQSPRGGAPPMVSSHSIPRSESLTSQCYGSRITIFNTDKGPQVVYDSLPYPESAPAIPYSRSPDRLQHYHESSCPISEQDSAEEQKLRARLAAL